MRYRIILQSVTPLVMHSNRCVDPLDPLTKEIKAITGKRKKTDADHLQIRRLEFEAGIYHSENLGPYIPLMNLRRMLIEGARKSKDGKQFESGCFVVADVPLQYEGPRDIEGLYKAGFAWTIPVGNQKNSIMRTRPKFDEWSLEFEVNTIDEVVSEDMLRTAVYHCECVGGLCDGRAIGMGRFRAEVKKLDTAESNGRIKSEDFVSA